MSGPLLPIGEYKGYGLSLFTDVLAGVMTGARFSVWTYSRTMTNFDVGHMMIAIDPAAMMSAEEFDRRLEELVRQVKGAEPINTSRPVMLPGEVEFRRMRERQDNGIPVSRETVDQLRALAADIGVAFPL